MKSFLETSISIYVFKRLSLFLNRNKQIWREIYDASQIHKIISHFWNCLKTCFKHSFLGKITEPSGRRYAVLDNSRILQFINYNYRSCRMRIVNSYNSVKTISLVGEAKNIFYFAPIKSCSIVTISLIAVNIFLAFLLKRQISFVGLIIRLAFLLLAIAGLFSKAKFDNINQSSSFLKWLKKSKS